MPDRVIPPGAKCVGPKAASEKFDRQKSWLWDKAKNDPTFPKPIYIGTRPVFLEHELDAYLQEQARLSDIAAHGEQARRMVAARRDKTSIPQSAADLKAAA